MAGTPTRSTVLGRDSGEIKRAVGSFAAYVLVMYVAAVVGLCAWDLMRGTAPNLVGWVIWMATLWQPIVLAAAASMALSESEILGTSES